VLSYGEISLKQYLEYIEQGTNLIALEASTPEPDLGDRVTFAIGLYFLFLKGKPPSIPPSSHAEASLSSKAFNQKFKSKAATSIRDLYRGSPAQALLATGEK